jgi:hypothetical protein
MSEILQIWVAKDYRLGLSVCKTRVTCEGWVILLADAESHLHGACILCMKLPGYHELDRHLIASPADHRQSQGCSTAGRLWNTLKQASAHRGAYSHRC